MGVWVYIIRHLRTLYRGIYIYIYTYNEVNTNITDKVRFVGLDRYVIVVVTVVVVIGVVVMVVVGVVMVDFVFYTLRGFTV